MTGTRCACLPGVPSWVSLAARDLDGAKDFYGPLLGWRFQTVPGMRSSYVHALAGETPVAGINATAHEWELPVTWTTYFGTESADAAVSRVQERGGTVAVGPLSADEGRLALAADPAGASFGVLECQAEPGRLRPSGVGGNAVWVELRTRDAFEAAMFYGGVFDWDRRPSPPYTVRWEEDRVILDIDDRTVATLYGGAVEGTVDPRLRPRWHVFFSVADVATAMELAEKLGGQAIGEPSPTHFGRTATLRDPEGGLFCVVSGHG